MMKLLGSLASPYVRRIRMTLHDKDYNFVKINIFNEEDQKKVLEVSPTLRIPILLDNEKVIWDSLLIEEYLANTAVSLEDKKDLVLINEMSDAAIQLFQLRKFATDPKDQSVLSQNNLKRIHEILAYFNSTPLDSWGLKEKWLYCTLDWFSFRSVVDWSKGNPALVQFMNKNSTHKEVTGTDPRL